jgi:DNA (cytosine-5)-methyltransferase 3A
MKKLLIGGSPCTFWSIAQKNGRETEAEGMGWELFKNYLIAKMKFRPDFFLYENNKSAAQPIKDQISRELGVPLMHINSALVSAQNRERFYAFNWEVDQPEDRGIVVRDILEDSTYEITYNLVHTVKPKSEQGVIRLGDIGSTAQAH